MVEDNVADSGSAAEPRRRRRAASRPAGPPAVSEPAEQPELWAGQPQQGPDSGGEAAQPTADEAALAEPGAPDAPDEPAAEGGQADDAQVEAPDQAGEPEEVAEPEHAEEPEEVAEPEQAEVPEEVAEPEQAEEPAQAEPSSEARSEQEEPAPESPGSGEEHSQRPARTRRRATRGVTTVAFSGEGSASPTASPSAPQEAPPVALFQPPDDTRAVRQPRRSKASASAEPTAQDQSTADAQPQDAGQSGQDAPTDSPAGPSADASARASTEDSTGDQGAEDLEAEDQGAEDQGAEDQGAEDQGVEDQGVEDSEGAPRRRRRRGGRRRRRGGNGAEPEGADEGQGEDQAAPEAPEAAGEEPEEPAAEAGEPGDEETASSRRRRRRRRRAGVSEEMEDLSTDDPEDTVVRVREGRRSAPSDEISSVRGSTRIEAKRQRRRDGREAGRRRAPILSEAEFLARRESVNRVMCVRQNGNRTQIAVLEDGVLVEHYVNRADSSSMVGNVYLGKVQNVLPSMEAAFVDIGRGRNAVLYAGEVNWDAAGLEGQPKRIELALKPGDGVLVQVTKDPVGHKGARLTSQISLPGRFLVYVPEGSMTGISRKLPDTERARLKAILKDVVPEGAGVIVRTAAEGASEEQLTADVRRLTAQWKDITKKAKSASPPTLLYGEPDLAIKVVRDIFNEDFTTLLVQGDSTWQTLSEYIGWVAPDLLGKLQKWAEEPDLYSAHRIDEQLAKALDRKVWLPSGGSLVIDRTEAMTVIDVNTGKFTGQGGNLEETVTKNNLEAAEEIVRQLRLRDIGGIIVVDFIDMVLESNRDLVLRRLVECLGRDRTKHQVAEVTSLGLVQMTRKRIGQGLLEAFSTPCEACGGRGHVVHAEPVGADQSPDEPNGRRERGGRRGRNAPVNLGGKQTGKTPPPPKFDENGHIDHSGDSGPETSGAAGAGEQPEDVGPSVADVAEPAPPDAGEADTPLPADAEPGASPGTEEQSQAGDDEQSVDPAEPAVHSEAV